MSGPTGSYGNNGLIAAVFCDGGLLGTNPSTHGGAWAYCYVDEAWHRIKEQAGLTMTNRRWPRITNNYMEWVAAVRALEGLPEGWEGQFCCDSAVTLGRLFRGWAMSGIPDSVARRGYVALARLGPGIVPVQLDGHPTEEHLATGRGKRGNLVSEHNVWCDRECARLMAHYMANVMRCGGFANERKD